MLDTPENPRRDRKFYFFLGGSSPVMKPSPSLTLPGSAIFSSGRRKGGNSADMNPSPSLTLAVSAILPSGRRKGGNGTGWFVADMVFLRRRTDPNSVSRRNLPLSVGIQPGRN